jgi:hypothetical protein
VSYTLLKEAPDIYLTTIPSVVRERKVKGRSFIHFSLRPDPATVKLDNALGYGQANADDICRDELLQPGPDIHAAEAADAEERGQGQARASFEVIKL